MKRRLRLIPLLLLAIIPASNAAAQDIGAWAIGSATTSNDTVRHTASLYSSTLITSGNLGPDYAPLYTISCQTGDAAHWTQRLQFEDTIAGGGQIELVASVDKKPPREELWRVGTKSRNLTRDNTPDIAELRTAKTLKLSWNWGWSWLWLSDEAQFDLGDIEAVVYTLSKNCGIAEPQ